MKRLVRGCRSGGITLILLSALTTLLVTTSPAAAVSPQYLVLAAKGPALTCDDMLWATSRGLLEPVEVHWLWDSFNSYECETQFLVMLAMGAKKQLTCADIEWNTVYEQLRFWWQISDLLTFVPECRISPYAILVESLAWAAVTHQERFGSCSDVNWYYVQGLITPEQRGWLADRIIRHAIPCPLPADPPPGSPPAPAGSVVVDYPVTGGASCYYEQDRYGYTEGGVIQVCRGDSNGFLKWQDLRFPT